MSEEVQVNAAQNSSSVATESPRPAPVEGFLPVDDVRRIFVEGAAWWEFHSRGATMWQSDRGFAEEEAEQRFPKGIVPLRTNITTGHISLEQVVADGGFSAIAREQVFMDRVQEDLNLRYHGIKTSERPAMLRAVEAWLERMRDSE